MGKRQQRLIGNISPEKMKEFMHSQVTVVLRNATSFAGQFFKIEEGDLFLRDHRGNVHRFSPGDIAEIILEKASAY